LIHNKDQKSKDYSHIKNTYRPSHADYVYEKKYGHRDYRGGGRSSARETASRVVAGAIAKQVLKSVKVTAYVSSVGKIVIDKHYSLLDFNNIEKNPVRCADLQSAVEMENYIKEIRKEGDTIGGVVSCVIENCPIGLGEPVFDKLHAELGKAMLSINAVKGFEFGSGFNGTKLKGSEHNDSFSSDGKTKTNNSGGIQGGISNGMDIYFKVAFKPVATIMKSQKTIDSKNNEVEMKGKGRHDPCVVPRAVPIVEAMSALVILDYYLLNKTYNI
jgi:chorismate synthase